MMNTRAPKTEKRSDVLVIGGGPSGLRVAGRLAARGLDVRVLEKKAAVGRNVVCTGIIGKDVFARFGLDPGSIIQEIRDVRLVSPFGTVLMYTHPRPFACVVDRETFDTGIAAAAESAGAAVSLGARVDDLTIERGGVRARAGTKEDGLSCYSAAMAVIACGVDIGLQKRAGLGYPRDFLQGAQAEVPARAGEPTTIFVGRNVAPGAFAWSVPAGDKARVGLLTKSDPTSLLRSLLRKTGAPGASCHRDEGEVRIRRKAIAQGLLPRTAGDRVLSVGEAAGQIKTTTGGGISYGLLCADLAAEAILQCFDRSSFGAEALAGYEAAWRKAIQKEIVIGYTTRRMCSRLSDRQVQSLFHLAQTDGIIPIIRETADFDWHSGLIAALLQRLSFMKHFRTVREAIAKNVLS
jgi:digeranylgeranylglycerophospholipid reductase